LRTRIILDRALERSPISLAHDLGGETWVKVYVYALLLLETLARSPWRISLSLLSVEVNYK
jgi:hypothetical protein